MSFFFKWRRKSSQNSNASRRPNGHFMEYCMRELAFTGMMLLFVCLLFLNYLIYFYEYFVILAIVHLFHYFFLSFFHHLRANFTHIRNDCKTQHTTPFFADLEFFQTAAIRHQTSLYRDKTFRDMCQCLSLWFPCPGNVCGFGLPAMESGHRHWILLNVCESDTKSVPGSS